MASVSALQRKHFQGCIQLRPKFMNELQISQVIKLFLQQQYKTPKFTVAAWCSG